MTTRMQEVMRAQLDTRRAQFVARSEQLAVQRAKHFQDAREDRERVQREQESRKARMTERFGASLWD